MMSAFVKFRLKTLLIGIAVIAVALEASVTVGRWRDYRRMAAQHARMEGALAKELAPFFVFKRKYGQFPGCGLTQASFQSDEEQLNRHAFLNQKYTQASRHPWIPVPPDPPPPR
jgi:hypothetical protein